MLLTALEEMQRAGELPRKFAINSEDSILIPTEFGIIVMRVYGQVPRPVT
jgi:hypothetical protein